MYSDARNPFGLLDGQLVTINDVPSGLACGCLCPKCKQPLVARKGAEKLHHFSHYKKTGCSGGLETALHLKSKEIFKEWNCLHLPNYFGQPWPRGVHCPPVNRFDYQEAFSEVAIGPVRPDVVLMGNHAPFLVELYVTHRLDYEKIRKIELLGLPCIEIDLRYLRRLNLLDQKLIENALIHCTHTKYWISKAGLRGMEEDVRYND